MVGDRWLVVRLGKEGEERRGGGWEGTSAASFLGWLVGREGCREGWVAAGRKRWLVVWLAGWLVVRLTV